MLPALLLYPEPLLWLAELEEDVDDTGLLYVAEPLREPDAALDVDEDVPRETVEFRLMLLLVPIPLRAVVEVLDADTPWLPCFLASFLLSDEPFVWALGAVYLSLCPPDPAMM